MTANQTDICVVFGMNGELTPVSVQIRQSSTSWGYELALGEKNTANIVFMTANSHEILKSLQCRLLSFILICSKENPPSGETLLIRRAREFIESAASLQEAPSEF